jgi:hypothetical protein
MNVKINEGREWRRNEKTMELRRKERRNKFKIKIMFSSNILRH